MPCGRARLSRLLDGAVREAARVARRRAPFLSVAVVGDVTMRRLNRDFHDADRTTDVLAFPFDADEDGVDGELILCAPEARRQAARRGLPFLTELLLYAVHGTLHLLGEEDHDPRGALRMRRLERAALERLGYPLPSEHLQEVDSALSVRRNRRR